MCLQICLLKLYSSVFGWMLTYVSAVLILYAAFCACGVVHVNLCLFKRGACYTLVQRLCMIVSDLWRYYSRYRCQTVSLLLSGEVDDRWTFMEGLALYLGEKLKSK